MKNFYLRAVCAAALIGGATILCAAPKPAFAQAATPPNVTLDLQDAPIRAALEQIFRAAKVDFGIDPSVIGYVNLKVTDIPFENALRLILRSSTTPLTYLKEGNVYLVRPRALADTTAVVQPPELDPGTQPRRSNYEQIELTYIDPADLAQLLGITILRVGVRNQAQGGQGGQGGGGGGIGGGGGLGGGGGFGGGGFGGGGMGGGGGGLGGGGGMGGGGFGGGGFGGGRGF